MIQREKRAGFILGGIACLILSGCDGVAQAQTTANSGAAPPFAVVELFTSEGCSSCPVADDYMADLVREAESEKRNIYPLAFHVDYWNAIGWKDRFSSKDYTRRQTDYARQLKLSSIYTPQMVVNGAREFVGSDRRAGKRAIDAALERPAEAKVALEVKSGATEEKKSGVATMVVSYAVENPQRVWVANIALVERGLTTQVGAGENGGRLLRHENVVRAFQSIPAKAEGELTLTPPDDVDLGNASVIAYVQDGEAGEILGAAIVKALF